MPTLFIKQFLVLCVLLFGLQACGSEDEASTEKTSGMPEDMETTTQVEPVSVPEPIPEPVEEVMQEPVPELVPEPAPELMHTVISQEAIYKNWPYQEEAKNIPEPKVDMVDQVVGKVVGKVEGKVEDKLADVTGQTTETISNVVDKGKEMMAEVVPLPAPVTETPAPPATGGAEHDVSAKGLTAFDKPIIYIAPGDTVHFKKLNGGHNSQSVFVPEGAEGWAGAMNKNISVTLTVPGIYGYLCLPHAGLGMNGVIVVGDAGDKEVVMEYLRGLPQTDFSRKLLGKVNKVKAENYVK